VVSKQEGRGVNPTEQVVQIRQQSRRYPEASATSPSASTSTSLSSHLVGNGRPTMSSSAISPKAMLPWKNDKHKQLTRIREALAGPSRASE